MSIFASKLPPNWKRQPIAINYHVTKKPRGFARDPDKPVPFIPMEHVPTGGQTSCGFELRKPSAIASGTYFEAGDILLSKITPSFENGKQGLAIGLPGKYGYGSTELIPLQQNTDDAVNLYLFYLLLHHEVRSVLVSKMEGSTGRQRVPEGAVRELEIPVPPKAEQERIAAVLWKLQRAIATQDRLIAATRDLKQSAMQRLFTHGLRGEPLKDTEIGQIPVSWKLARCETVTKAITVGVVVRPASHYVENGVPAFRSFNVREDFLDDKNLVYFDQGANDTLLSKSKLSADDVLIVRTGYPGTSCVVPQHYDGANCIDLVLVRPDREIVLPEFLSRFFNSHLGRSQTLSSSYGLAQKHLNIGAVKTTLAVVPEIDEQRDIAAALATIDRKLAHHQRKRAALNDLFQTTLHVLMTAKVRVADLYIDTSEVTASAPKGEVA